MTNKIQSVDTETKETQGKHYEVDVRKIIPLNRAGGNIRTDYGQSDGSFDELVKSIEENGVLVPLRAFRNPEVEGGWIAIDGHRRHAAAMKLVEKGNTVRMKVITVDPRKYSDEQMIIDMVVTNSGKPLNPLELSEAVGRLIKLGLKPKEVAAKFGMNTNTIRNLELLGSAPKRVRMMIEENKISFSVALEFLKNSADFNDAIAKIESAFTKIEARAAEKGKTAEGKKVTYRDFKEENNMVDSCRELRIVFKKLIDNPKAAKNTELFSFAKRLVENKLTASDIEKLLF